MAGVTNGVGVMQPVQDRMRRIENLGPGGRRNEKPGAEFRPGSILQFQFPE
jgi:hypothetical protein